MSKTDNGVRAGRGAMRKAWRLGALLAALQLGGCASGQYLYDQSYVGGLRHGAPGMPAKDDPSYRATLEMWQELLDVAGKRKAGESAVAWKDEVAFQKAVLEGGMNRVDAMCRRYFQILGDLDKRRRAAKAEVSLAGTTTIAVLTAALSNAAKTIGYVGIGYGALNSLIDIETDQYMYERSPQEAEGLILAGLASARAESVGKLNESSEEHIKYLLGAYSGACTPGQIDSQVRAAIKRAEANVEGKPNATFTLK